MPGRDAYEAYGARFDALLGPSVPGDYRKHDGRLIKRLSAAEFAEQRFELEEAQAAYAAILERGDTISDALIRLISDRAAELLVPNPL